MIAIAMIELEQVKRIKGAWRKRFYAAIEVPIQPAVRPTTDGIFVNGLSYQARGFDLKMNTYFSNVSLSIDKGELITLVSAQHAHKTVLI